jgi:ATP-GRASP peptide maturase of grasp-with-spasm system
MVLSTLFENMILIQSINEDLSTTEVIKWLVKYNAEFIRLNNNAEISEIKFINNSFEIILENKTRINLNDIDAYWYRRGDFTISPKIPRLKDRKFGSNYRKHIFYENKALYDFLINHLKNKIFSIGDINLCQNVNKNINVQKAKELGLDIPESIITTDKSDVVEFHKKFKNIITKSIDHTFSYSDNKRIYQSYTESITPEIIDQMPDKFQATLFQQEIKKKIEVRSFYLKGKFYSMAIFSQNDNQTSTDFRVYNDNKPNRNVPFQLPKEIETKLNKLMQALKYESGSIDIIYGIDKKFYFLEINPIGQFSMVSFPCNYYLEKEIALQLINKK